LNENKAPSGRWVGKETDWLEVRQGSLRQVVGKEGRESRSEWLELKQSSLPPAGGEGDWLELKQSSLRQVGKEGNQGVK
jgi:hypothetical protein